ncbi:MAG: Ig-like domain-containing protein [Bifidobacteriaceae bacterium]|nr:Ig-like domain-containing protein [Bifidobacteriaceae bacterium]
MTVRVTVVARRGAGVASVRARVPKSLRVHQVAWVTGTPKPGTAVGARVTYRSSAPAVASIDSAGRLTATKAGRAVITVRAGGKSKRVRVTVK